MKALAIDDEKRKSISKAYKEGVRFYKANDDFYLVDLVPAKYLVSP